jgi:hypothetical protein
MKTKVKVTFFKGTGKWYSSFEFKTKWCCGNISDLKKECISHKEFIGDMDWTMEFNSVNGIMFNMYLYKID